MTNTIKKRKTNQHPKKVIKPDWLRKTCAVGIWVLIFAIICWDVACEVNLPNTLLPAAIQSTKWFKYQIYIIIVSCIIILPVFDEYGVSSYIPAIISTALILVVLLFVSASKINTMGKGHETEVVYGKVTTLEEQHHTIIGRHKSKTYYYWVAVVDFDIPVKGRLLMKIISPFPYVEGEKCRFRLSKGLLGMYYAEGYYVEESAFKEYKKSFYPIDI